MNPEGVDDLSLPGRLGDITPEWLSAALSIRYPGTEVTAVATGNVWSGAAGKIRLLLDYNERGHEHGLPATMVAKGGFGHNDLAASLAEIYIREALFYRDLGADCGINIPRCYFAGVNRSERRGVVLLEDLYARNVQFGHATQPIGPELMKKALDLLARLHAGSWEIVPREAVVPFPTLLEGPVFQFILSPENWAKSLALPRAAVLPIQFHDRARVEKALRVSWDLARSGPACLIHSDPHLGNMYFEPGGSPGLLDWQFAMSGPWAHDVQWCMVGSLDIEDRRAYEQELLAYYLERISAHGVLPPSFDEAWLSYRQNLAYGLLWVADPDELQASEVNRINTERFAAAAADHEVFDLLGI